MNERPRVLVVDDDEKLLQALSKALEAMGYEVRAEARAPAALEGAAPWGPDVALVDLKMPGMGGLELGRALRERIPGLPVVVLTGYGTIRGAVDALRQGMYDYLTKPFDLDEVDATLRRAIEQGRLARERDGLSEALARAGPPPGLVAASPAMRGVLERVEAVARTDSTVLITGETGTGKELVAREIHRRGPRAAEPFITVDCAALHGAVLESELFGHVKGAFTGAYRDRAGYFEVASGGTVFLDEIGELELGVQKKLLRVLEYRTYSRVGETRERRTDARLVAATNRDLEAEAAAGRFRPDLFYRLGVVQIRIPPLRERPEDIGALVAYHLPLLAKRLGRRTRAVTPEALRRLESYPWPGNVRELVNTLEQALVFHDVEVLGAEQVTLPGAGPASESEPPGLTYAEVKARAVDEVSRRYLEALLTKYGGNVSKVARHAGLNRRHVHRLLQDLSLDPSRYRTRR
ncbi:sigma-54-dependent transcriptional regulator [Deferrisoma sp.]